MRKELDNAQKQIVSYQKEIEKLKYRLQTTHTTERYIHLSIKRSSNFTSLKTVSVRKPDQRKRQSY